MATNSLEQVGYVMLFHFDKPYHHSRHCYDWATDIGDRIRGHYERRTSGPNRLSLVLSNEKTRRAVGVRLVSYWPGTKSDMLKFRKAGNAVRYCDMCKQERKMKWQEDHLEELLEKSITKITETIAGVDLSQKTLELLGVPTARTAEKKEPTQSVMEEVSGL